MSVTVCPSLFVVVTLSVSKSVCKARACLPASASGCHGIRLFKFNGLSAVPSYLGILSSCPGCHPSS
eukprot:1808197-Rhodomonas_salina.1